MCNPFEDGTITPEDMGRNPNQEPIEVNDYLIDVCTYMVDDYRALTRSSLQHPNLDPIVIEIFKRSIDNLRKHIIIHCIEDYLDVTADINYKPLFPEVH